MPTIAKVDRLLSFSRIILNLLSGLMVVLGIGVALLIPIILISPGRRMTRRLVESGIGQAELPWIATLLALLVGGIVLAFLFLRKLRRIVSTVSDGDPFVPANAERLRTMAWLVLAMQGLTILATPLVIWFDAYPHKANVHHNDNGISLGSLVLALLLFVLARVFRRGTEMRDELEGTV